MNTRFLLENGAEFIDRSVKSYHEKDFKGSVVNLWTGLLLLFKYKIATINPVFIFSDVLSFVEIDHGKLSFKEVKENCNSKTIDFNEIVLRLYQLEGDGSYIFKYHKTFKKIQKLRNRIEHFIYDMKDTDFLELFHEIMPFLNDFIEKEIEEDLPEVFKSWNKLLEVETFAKKRMEEMVKMMKENEHYDRKFGSYQETFNCQKCGKGEMINVGGYLLCGFCKHRESFDVCSRCGRTVPDSDDDRVDSEIDMCGDCWDSIMNGND